MYISFSSSFILLKIDFLTGFLCFFRWQRTQCFVIWSFNSGKPLTSYNTLGQIWRFRRTGTSPCNSGRLHLLNWWTSLYWKDSSEYRSCLLRKGNFILYTVLQMFRQVLFLAWNHSNHRIRVSSMLPHNLRLISIRMKQRKFEKNIKFSQWKIWQIDATHCNSQQKITPA